jgi:membrane fusion protein, copper/silver efflux system
MNPLSRFSRWSRPNPTPRWLAAAILGLLLLAAGTPAPAETPAEPLYTCGMHPQVIQNRPGNCPICGMKLTPVRKQPGAGATSTAIAIDPVTIQNMDLRTAPVSRGPLRRVVRTVGVVEFDETTLADVTTKFKGWIVKLYVDTTGQQVHRGQVLFDIYSPELYSAQVEYLLALQSTNASLSGQALKASALAKLRYFDVPDEQIAEIEKRGQAKKALPIQAPRDGVVVEKLVVEGQMVDAGMKLYRLADLGTVWVQSQIYEQDLPLVRLGLEATVSLSYLEDRKFRGRVTYIYPTVDEKTRTAKVRMEFHNPGYFLKPGMFTTVELTADLSPSALLVPDMAVLRSGRKNTVFVALPGGKFEPREVVLGPRAGGDAYQVLSGLQEGDRVVVSGQFMLDSESQLREAIQKMRGAVAGAAPQAVTTTPGAGAAPAAWPTNAPSSGGAVYLCPMPEHVSLEYDHPGNCPLCGMTLVPVTREALARIQPGGKLEYYTCPMPEHSDVHEPKPGKCPRCGMTLIPVMVEPGPTPATHSPPPTTLYTCPMASHAEVVADKPGLCPKCEMELVNTRTVPHGNLAEAKWRAEHTPARQPSTQPSP